MPKSRYRTLIICSHPVQYMSPMLRQMAQHPQIDLQVAYCCLRGAHAGHSPQQESPFCPGFRGRRTLATDAVPKGTRLGNRPSRSLPGFRKSIGVAGCVQGIGLDGPTL
jgi:hypothetical protein